MVLKQIPKSRMSRVRDTLVRIGTVANDNKLAVLVLVIVCVVVGIFLGIS